MSMVTKSKYSIGEYLKVNSEEGEHEHEGRTGVVRTIECDKNQEVFYNLEFRTGNAKVNEKFVESA